MPDSNSQVTKRVEHTPGPWAKQGQWNTPKGVAECIEAGDWGIIGAWIDRSNEPCGNLDLIAAAPELLYALETAILASGFHISGPTHPDVCEDEGDPRWVGLARAAIAKARGQ